ncbi:YwpF family protein, partial [Bacillus pumilus]|uniref:YwpF family protein n=1 Tax=Bacillus pumilus TaxID=1408 RepID=UPI0011A38156
IQLHPNQHKISTIPLPHPLIINKQHPQNHSIIHPLIPNKHTHLFQLLFQHHTQLNILLTITKQNNPPLHLSLQLKNILPLQQNISLLLHPNIITNPYTTQTQQLLKHLLKHPLSPQKFLHPFKQNT